MSFHLLGIGTATPEHPLSAADALGLANRFCCENDKQRRITDVLYRCSGVETRRTAVPHTYADRWNDLPDGPSLGERMTLYEEHAGPLAVRSARAALQDAGLAPSEVTHLVTVSCTGFEAPGVDCRLMDDLSLSDETQRVNVGFMGCHGALNGLRVAKGLAADDPEAIVLVVATELCSLHYAWGWEPERMVGNALFGDGSAAVVGTASPAKEATHRLAATGSVRFPGSADLMSWRVRDHGFEMHLSSDLPDLIETGLEGWITPWLAKRGYSPETIGAWAVHPGGPKVLTAVEAALDLPGESLDVSRAVLREHGNMSSATVLFLLERLRNAGTDGPTLMLGFGPGIVAEAALWE